MISSKRSYKNADRRPYKRQRMPKLTLRQFRNENLISCKRTVTLADFTVSTTWSARSFAFALSALPSYSEFGNLFEQYRINAVKLQFIPFFDGNDLGSSAANVTGGAGWFTNPRLYHAIDKDGNGATGSETALQEYSDVKIVTEPMKPFVVYIKNPCVQVATANALTLVGGAPKSRQWIDTDNYNIQHYGCVVGAIAPFASAGYAFKYSVVATYYMEFKGVV